VQVDIDMVDADDVFSLRAASDGGQTVRSADGLYSCLLFFIAFINALISEIFELIFYCGSSTNAVINSAEKKLCDGLSLFLCSFFFCQLVYLRRILSNFSEG